MGCKEVTQKKKYTNFELGKGKLIDEEDYVKAVKYLNMALEENPENSETRILLIIACRRSLEDGSADMQNKRDEYQRIAREEFEKLDTEREIRAIINIIRDRDINIIQKDAMQLLIEKGENAVKLSISALINYAFIHDQIVEVLTRIGEPALDDLVATLEKPTTNSSTKLDIVRIIGNMKTDEATPVLEKIVKSQNITDKAVKMEAMASLFERGEKQYEKDILKGLDSPNVNVRRPASHAMIYMNRSPVKRLIKTLKDPDEQVRINALKGVERNPDKDTIEPLIEMLKNDKVESEIQKYENQLKEMSNKLKEFEKEYEKTFGAENRMSSDVFYDRFKDGKISKRMNFFDEWASLYEKYRNISALRDNLVAQSDRIKNHLAEALIGIGKASYASKVIKELVNELQNEKEWKTRLTILRVLKDNQIIDKIDQESEYKIWKHYQESEDNKMVKSEIVQLLNRLDNIK